MDVLIRQWSLAWRNLVRQRRRSAIALVAVAFGVIALMLASGFVEWIFDDMRESTIHAQLGHLTVVRPGYLQSGLADPTRYLLPDAGSARRAVEALPDVRIVAPRLDFAGLVSHGDTTVSFVGEGVEASAEAELSRGLGIVAGARLAAGDAEGALLGAGLARNLGVTVGDRVAVLVNKSGGGVSGLEFVVRGLFTSVSKAYDDSAMRVPIAAAQRLLGVAGANAWLVLLDDTTHTDRTASAIRSALPKRDFEVVPWYRQADFYNKTVALFSRQVLVVKVIIAAIIVLGISNTMMMNVIERTGEIGTAMALGVTRRGILALFMLEGAVTGAVSGLAGALLGIALAFAISAVGIPMPPPPGMDHGYVAQILVTPGLTLEAIALALGTTLVACAYPAWKASRLSIVDALRHNR
jgi:putative ABC transport system permease protein